MILRLDIIDRLDQSFNLSDYPALVAFDGYHNMDLRNVDPTGCPEAQVLSVENGPGVKPSMSARMRNCCVSNISVAYLFNRHKQES